METYGKFSLCSLIIAALFIFSIASFNTLEASQQTISRNGIRAENNLLQFTAGNHVLGFTPNRAYLAALDHALSVEFLGTKGVTPKSDRHVQAGKPAKALPMGKVTYENLWDGISLTYEATQKGIAESTYHIAPKADVSNIRLKYNVPVELHKDGRLKFSFSRGQMTETAPVAWQEINGKKKPVKVAFRVEKGEVGFAVGKYDPGQELIIDPTYSWNTFWGSNTDDSYVDIGKAIALDSAGNIYVTGYSRSSWNGIAHAEDVGPIHAHSGAKDVFVLKLNNSGTYLWHTFWGATNDDEGNGIAVDGNGDVYITGYSKASWDGVNPIGGPVSPIHALTGSVKDIFVLKLSSSGVYQWHTFWGSTNDDEGNGIAIDGSDNVYVAGTSISAWQGDNPPRNAHSGGSGDICVLKLNSSGILQWNAFYGGNNSDIGNAIATDSTGNSYITGQSYTAWPDYTHPQHNHNGDELADIVVLKIDNKGDYVWHTFYGAASNSDAATGIALDGQGLIYVTGYSKAEWSGVSPINAHSAASKQDIFVLKLNRNGTYGWHTFQGSDTEDDYGQGIAVNASGVYVTGFSLGTWGSPLNAYQGYQDIVILKLDSEGELKWNTFYGTYAYTLYGIDNGNGITIDSSGSIYVTGDSDWGWGSPTRHAHTANTNADLIVLKMIREVCTEYPAMIDETGAPYDSITNAYSAASSFSAQTILMQSMTGEALSLNGLKSVKLKGGYYECDFSSNGGITTVPSLTIGVNSMAVYIDGLTIK